MSAGDQNEIYMYRLSAAGDAIVVNRTLAIIADETGPFLVRVTDRNYQYDPSGEEQTIIFDKSFGSIADAEAGRDRQIRLSLNEGFLHNIAQFPPF